jgi:hypothetical protein
MEKMRSIETVSGMSGRRIEDSYEGGKLTMIYSKNFCKYYNEHPVGQ